jgi:hypothetical protein
VNMHFDRVAFDFIAPAVHPFLELLAMWERHPAEDGCAETSERDPA